MSIVQYGTFNIDFICNMELFARGCGYFTVKNINAVRIFLEFLQWTKMAMAQKEYRSKFRFLLHNVKKRLRNTATAVSAVRRILILSIFIDRMFSRPEWKKVLTICAMKYEGMN